MSVAFVATGFPYHISPIGEKTASPNAGETKAVSPARNRLLLVLSASPPVDLDGQCCITSNVLDADERS